MNGYIGVDLDGTLAYHGDTWDGVSIHEPVPAMLARVKVWLATGKEVRIITARVAPNKPFLERLQQHDLIKDWCKKHLDTDLPVQAYKCPDMIELWDDRAIQIIRDTGEIATMVAYNNGLNSIPVLDVIVESVELDCHPF